MLHKIIVILVIICTSNIYAEIITTSSISYDEEIYKKINNNSFVFIDFDNVIITPRSQLFRKNNNPDSEFLSELYGVAAQKHSMNNNIATLLANREIMLVEKDWPKFIQNMENNGALVFGISNKNSATDLIHDFEIFTYINLKKLNINFSDNFKNNQSFLLDNNDTISPIFYLGIIFTKYNIGQTLIKFMKFTNIVPENIFVFSNNKNELINIERSLNILDVNYYGIYYRGIWNIESNPNRKITTIQKNELQENNRWIEDEEIEKMINNDNDYK
jgi:hypothetical protein